MTAETGKWSVLNSKKISVTVIFKSVKVFKCNLNK